MTVRPASLLAQLLAFGGLCVALILGARLAAWAGVPVPGAVMGLLLLLAGLFIANKVPAALEDVAALLIRHLNLFFVPAGVGLMAYAGLVARDIWPILAALFVSTLLGLLVTALVFKWLAPGDGEERS
ncbi:CidA/LrgA family protein [Tepidicaulis sp. LMO-SS28]|uniref:CidA/LrgA family protein n=1 Tax=Tepidicaulis sp. LMO-SS28 TaxID=3447455 RepID=UPI003EE10118